MWIDVLILWLCIGGGVNVGKWIAGPVGSISGLIVGVAALLVYSLIFPPCINNVPRCRCGSIRLDDLSLAGKKHRSEWICDYCGKTYTESRRGRWDEIRSDGTTKTYLIKSYRLGWRVFDGKECDDE